MRRVVTQSHLTVEQRAMAAFAARVVLRQILGDDDGRDVDAKTTSD